MKILWIKSDFLHPTTRGGQIRTLEMLRRLHARHEVHYVAFDDPSSPEGLQRTGEYASRVYPIAHYVPPKASAAFVKQLLVGLVDPLPVAVARYRSDAMRRTISDVRKREQFDSVVCDFLFPTPNIEDLGGCVLFQHNVETMIWRRHTEHASGLKRMYFSAQAKRMFDWEAKVCRSCEGVIGVSSADARLMEQMFGVKDVGWVPTGVDVDYFRPRAAEPAADLVFLGSMDWMPNIDGMEFFVRDVLPLIRKRRPDCTVAIVGRKPAPAVVALGERDPHIRVTGTVDDVRPWLWGSAVSIVPLRIGGGTRLKIYESMAAGIPVVSTTVGAEGLDVSSPENIRLADRPEEFADCCVELLANASERTRMSRAASELVAQRFSWDSVTGLFENLLTRSMRAASIA